ncbi:MAG: hypothetical protein ACUVR8_09020 [Acidobacteriota bacterium]
MKTFFSACRYWTSGWWQNWQHKRAGFSVAGLGVSGRAVTALTPRGFICLAGELWAAEAPWHIAGGEAVTVVGSYGVWLVVQPSSLEAKPPVGE